MRSAPTLGAGSVCVPGIPLRGQVTADALARGDPVGGLRLARLIALQPVEGTDHAAAAFVQHVGVNHGGRHVRVPEQFLHRADVVAAFQQVGGEGMAPMPITA